MLILETDKYILLIQSALLDMLTYKVCILIAMMSSSLFCSFVNNPCSVSFLSLKPNFSNRSHPIIEAAPMMPDINRGHGFYEIIYGIEIKVFQNFYLIWYTTYVGVVIRWSWLCETSYVEAKTAAEYLRSISKRFTILVVKSEKELVSLMLELLSLLLAITPIRFVTHSKDISIEEVSKVGLLSWKVANFMHFLESLIFW